MTVQRILSLAISGAYENEDRLVRANREWKRIHGRDNGDIKQLIVDARKELATLRQMFGDFSDAD